VVVSTHRWVAGLARFNSWHAFAWIRLRVIE
jgi:hypothetical protein